MIVPMKKVSILVMDKEREASLERLRELGVIHLEKKAATSLALTELTNRHSHLETARGVLIAFPANKKSPPPLPEYEGDLADYIISLSERRKRLQDSIHTHQQEINRYAGWGEFDPKDIAYLADKGVDIYLYEMPLDSYMENVGDIPVVVLSTYIDNKDTYVRLAAFGLIPEEKAWAMPEAPLSVNIEMVERYKADVAQIEQDLAALSLLMKKLEAERDAVQADIEFETARAGMELIDEKKSDAETDLSVSWISGFIPAPEMPVLEQATKDNGWAFCAVDPAEEDAVPTKLENGKFVSLIYPVMGFLDVTPGYRERDISTYFLIFLTLFFGMIFGDAAYGAILLIVSIVFITKTAKTGVPPFFKFLLLMSASNFIWGLLSGSWFGIDIAKIPQILQNVSLPLITIVSHDPGWISSYNANNFWINSGLVAPQISIEAMSQAIETNLKLFCFTIALVHLCLAHIICFISEFKAKTPRCLSEIGRLCMLFAMYNVVLSMVVYNAGFERIESWHLNMLAVGFVLVFIFNHYQGSVIKSVVSSFSDIISLFLAVTGAFSDITSYIRLWAVALAGASIAVTLNGLAEPMLSNIFLLVFGVVFFACGHIFNIVLCAMSFLVHGIRLNTLEFSSHLGLEWTGFPFKPFAKRF